MKKLLAAILTTALLLPAAHLAPTAIGGLIKEGSVITGSRVDAELCMACRETTPYAAHHVGGEF